MNILDKVKKLVKNENSKQLLTNLFIFLVIGVIIMIAASTFTNDSDNKTSELGYDALNQTDQFTNEQNLIEDYAENLEKKLEEILSSISGIGKVKVMITLEDTAERIPAINTTESNENTTEKDAQGGTREVVKDDLAKQVVTSNNNGKESLVIIKEKKPKVNGVVVVAEGVENAELKEKIYRAVKTVLGIPGNKVEVFSSN